MCLLVPFSFSEIPVLCFLVSLSSPEIPEACDFPWEVPQPQPSLHLLWLLFFTLSCLLGGLCGLVCVEPQLIMRCLGLLYEGRLGCPKQGKPFFSASQNHAKVLSMPKGSPYNNFFFNVHTCFICVWIGVCVSAVPTEARRGCQMSWRRGAEAQTQVLWKNSMFY